MNQSCFWRDIYLPNVLIPNDGWGGVNPSESFSEALIANDGMDSYRRKAWILTYDDMIYNMPYDDDADVNTDELKSKDPLRGIKSKNGVFGNAGYWSYKLAPLRSDLIVNNTSTTQQNDIVMRYAEVLLLYAEAALESGKDLNAGRFRTQGSPGGSETCGISSRFLRSHT